MKKKFFLFASIMMMLVTYSCTEPIDMKKEIDPVTMDATTKFVLENSEKLTLRACVVIDDQVIIFPGEDDDAKTVVVKNFSVGATTALILALTVVTLLVIVGFAAFISGNI
jgi:hypothetical protein